MNNVITVSFLDDSKAYEGLTLLKELDGQKQLSLAEGAVVFRREDGQIETKDVIGDNVLVGTATGGVVGLIIGILGGPIGVLVGGATGVLVGSLFDAHDDDQTDSALAMIGRSVEVGRATVLAQVGEQSPDVLDAAMAPLGGVVLRRSVDDVEGEIAAAEHAQRAAKRAARKELVDRRREQAKETIRAKLQELKAKLRHPIASAGN